MGSCTSVTHTRLDRAVAIKVLLDHLDQDAGSGLRVTREARCSLRSCRANIATIHGVEETERGSRTLILERDGRDAGRAARARAALGAWLSSCAPRSPRPWKRPTSAGDSPRSQAGNVMVTEHGTGQGAGLWPGAIPRRNHQSSCSPPRSTSPAISPGRLGYMSPEQALGGPTIRADRHLLVRVRAIRMPEPAGARCGKRTHADSIAAVLNEPPDWSAFRPDTAPDPGARGPLPEKNPAAPAPRRDWRRPHRDREALGTAPRRLGPSDHLSTSRDPQPAPSRSPASWAVTESSPTVGVCWAGHGC